MGIEEVRSLVDSVLAARQARGNEDAANIQKLKDAILKDNQLDPNEMAELERLFSSAAATGAYRLAAGEPVADAVQGLFRAAGKTLRNQHGEGVQALESRLTRLQLLDQANAGAQQIIELAAGNTDAAAERQILRVFKEAQDPGAQQLLLGALRNRGWDYLRLFKEMDSPDRQAEFLRLTIPGMDAERKAEAIAQFAEGGTPADQETAMTAILASEREHDGREALLLALESRGITFDRLVEELEDKLQRAQFLNTYLRLEQYAERRARGGPSADGPVSPPEKGREPVDRTAGDKAAEDVPEPTRRLAQETAALLQGYQADKSPDAKDDTFEGRLRYKIQYLQQLQAQARQIGQHADDMERRGGDQHRHLDALDAMGGAIMAQVAQVYADIQKDLEQVEKLHATHSVAIMKLGWDLLQAQPKSLQEAQGKQEKLAVQLQGTEDRIAWLKQRKAEALKTLGIEGDTRIAPELLAKLQEEAGKKPGGDGDVTRSVDIMSALLTLQTVDQQIEGLAEIAGHLKAYQQDLDAFVKETGQVRTTLQENLNTYLKAVGSEPIRGAGDQDLEQAVRTLEKRLGMPETGNFRDAQALGKIFQEMELRMAIADRIVGAALVNEFGYSLEELKTTCFKDFSNEGMARGISTLRKELRLQDSTPPGKLDPQERQQFEALARNEPVDKPCPLLRRYLDRKKAMASFTRTDLSYVRQVIRDISGSANGAVTPEQLLKYLADLHSGKISVDQPGPKRDAILKLFRSEDQPGKLAPNDLFRMLETAALGGKADNLLGSGDVDKFAAFVNTAGGSGIPINAFSDQRWQADNLHQAFKDKNKGWAIAIFDSMDNKQRMSLAIAYQAKYGRSIAYDIREYLPTRDQRDALYSLGKKDIKQGVEESLQFAANDSLSLLANPEFPNGIVVHPAKAGTGQSLWYDQRLAERARQVFQQFHVETDPAKKEALRQQFGLLWAVNSGRGFQEIRPIGPNAGNVGQAYDRFIRSTDPNEAEKLARGFITQVTVAQDGDWHDYLMKQGKIDDYIKDLETARMITKSVAVAAVATAVTVATFGAGTAAGAGFITVYGGSLVVGTMAGTAMGTCLEAEQQLLETGKIDKSKLTQASQEHLKTAFSTSLGTVTGMGFARWGQAASVALKGSKFGNLAVQLGVGGLSNATIDTAGHLIQGQKISAGRVMFSFGTGMITHKVGLHTGKWALPVSVGLGTASETAWSAMSGQPLKDTIVQGLTNNVIVGLAGARSGKWLGHAEQIKARRLAEGTAPKGRPDWGAGWEYLRTPMAREQDSSTGTNPRVSPERETTRVAPKQPTNQVEEPVTTKRTAVRQDPAADLFAELQKRFKFGDRDRDHMRKSGVDAETYARLIEGGLPAEDVVKYAQMYGPKTIAIIDGVLGSSAKIKPSDAVQAARRALHLGLTDDIHTLLRSGKLRNPEALKSFLEKVEGDFKQYGTSNHLKEIKDALWRVQHGREVSLGGTADVQDHSRNQSIQHKNIDSADRQGTIEHLEYAAEQLAGEHGEVPPPGAERIISVRLNNPEHPLYKADSEVIRQFLREALTGTSKQGNRFADAVEQVHIRNGKRTYVFTIDEIFPERRRPAPATKVVADAPATKPVDSTTPATQDVDKTVPATKTVGNAVDELLRSPIEKLQDDYTPQALAAARERFRLAGVPEPIDDKTLKRLLLGDRIYQDIYNAGAKDKPATISQSEFSVARDRYEDCHNGSYWHHRFGKVGEPSRDLRRFYFNVLPDEAVKLADFIAAELNKRGIPFRYKMPKDVSEFNRSDSAVLYVDKPDYQAVKELVQEYARQHPEAFADGSPAFTKLIARGIASAEEPPQQGLPAHPVGERLAHSFGTSRSQIIAEAIIEAPPGSTSDQIRQLVRARLIRYGFDPDRPWLNPGATMDDF